jgi:hypothetical protein
MNDHIRGEDLAAYLDGRLSADKKSELENHFSRCPACFDELVEIAEIMRGRDKIPAHFLSQALEEKSGALRPALRLRLVFEVAAAVLVVVFIGYFFLGGNRSWQALGGQKPSVVIEERVRRQDDEAAAPLKLKQRNRADTRKANNERVQAAADRPRADSLVSAKKISAVVDKDLPKKELARTATAPVVVGAVQTDFAAKGQPTAQAMATKAAETEQNLETFKEPGAGAALPAAPGKKQDAALMQKGIADKRSASPVRIEGDVDWPDLLNPELIMAWSWFPKELALELQIDGAGTVTTVEASGNVDDRVAARGKNEAKKLLFSISKKKSRRARLVANDPPI